MTNFKLSAFMTMWCILAAYCLSAQMTSYGNMYIHHGAEIFVHGKLIFNANNGAGTHPGIITTSRHSQSPGVVSLMGSEWENAAEDRFVDGYVKVYNDNPFTFPIGNLGNFQPISISGASGTTAAYIYDDARKLPFIDSSVSLRSSEATTSDTNVRASDVEYWDLRGEKATKVTLHWDVNSTIEHLTNGDLSNLTVVGWNGSSWEVISSSVDQNVFYATESPASFSGESSTYSFGSITTDGDIVPDDYDVITFGVLSSEDLKDGETEFGSELVNNETIELTLFPNPTTDLSNINIDYDLSQTQSDATLVIFDSRGETVYTKQLLEKEAVINLSYQGNTSGVYHIGIYTENGSKVFKPVVITQN